MAQKSPRARKRLVGKQGRAARGHAADDRSQDARGGDGAGEADGERYDGRPGADLYLMDAVRFLTHSCPSADLIVTDPPYSSLEIHRSRGTTTRLTKSKASSSVWFPTVPDTYFPAFFRACWAALRKDRHLYVMADHVTMPAVVTGAQAAGFRYWKPLVWDKVAIGLGYHYRARYELVLFFEKGKRKLNDLGIADVLRHPRVSGPGAYPTQKPVPLFDTLIRQSTQPGERVVDPFVGSGTAAVAARQLGRKFAGADVVQAALDRTIARLDEADAIKKIKAYRTQGGT
jgi:site-specific DNA-methyltransferase (adenine-specific)